MKASLVRLVILLMAVIGVAGPHAASATTTEEQAEIAASAAVPAPTGAIGEPVPHPGAIRGTEAIIYFSDFEANNGGLTPSLDWEWGTYAWAGGAGCSGGAPAAAAYSGSGLWGTVLNDCYSNLGNNSGYDTCVNGNPTDDSILSLTVDLTGYTDAQLSWWEWTDLFLNWDWAEVYANGSVVFQHCGTGYIPPTAWVQQLVDLTAYVGGSVTIEFHMMSSSVVAYSGWYIDDLQVSGTPVPVELQSLTVE